MNYDVNNLSWNFLSELLLGHLLQGITLTRCHSFPPLEFSA